MHRRQSFSWILVLMLFFAGCAARNVEPGQLYPAPASPLVPGEAFVAASFPGNEKASERFAHTLTAGNDSLRLFVEMVERPAIVEARITVFNSTRSIFDLGPGDFELLAENGDTLRRIECHDLANELLQKNAYGEKPRYSLNWSVTGPGEVPGNQYPSRAALQGAYRSSVETDEGPIEVKDLMIEAVNLASGPVVELGSMMRSVGPEIEAAARREAAERVYRAGIGERMGVVPGSMCGFSLFWRNRPQKRYPLRLQLRDSSIEFAFVAKEED